MSEEKTEDIKDAKPKKSNNWCCWVPAGIFLLAFVAYVIIQIIPYDFTEHSPARNYQLPAPSAEALNRKLDCQDFPIYKNNPTKYKPLCLNLYQTSIQEFNAASVSGQYNKILVYGQYLTFEITVPTTIRKVDNLGEAVLRVAKFNDLITLPKMMAYYSVDSLDFIPKQLSPYPAIYVQFANQDEVKEKCKAYVGGCAILNFGMVIKYGMLMEHINLGGLINRPNSDSGDVFEYDKAWPSDCYAEEVIIHETGHNLLVANKIGVKGISTSGWLKAPSYFNENLTEILTHEFPDEVCGAGTTKIVKDVIGGKNMTGGLIEFNGVYPPAMLHPTSYPKDNSCELAIMNTYSHYLLKGDFKTQFTKFIVAFRQAMKDNAYAAFEDDKKMANFMVKMLGNDPAEKEFLNSHACGI